MAATSTSLAYRIALAGVSLVLVCAMLAAAPVHAASGEDAAAGPETWHSLEPGVADGEDGWYRTPVEVTLHADGGAEPIERTEFRVNGGQWQTYGNAEEVIFDGTQESFERWRQAGPGQFVPLPDGSILSWGGLGMLWYPVRDYGDVALKLEWRDVRPSVTGASNSGVFMRFPHPEETAALPEEERFACQTGSAQTQPAWVAIACGHEIQIYDGDSGEPQKTGSIYNFAPIGLEEAQPNTQGEWNDYEIRTVGGGDYTVTVLRNGEVINEWANTPGQDAMRDGDPGTDERQFDRGYIGLQNHGQFDYTAFRNIRVQQLSEPIRIDVAGRHTIDYRSVDQAGTVGETGTVTVNYDPAAPTTTASFDPDSAGDGGTSDGPVTVTLAAADAANASDVARIEHRLDGGDWQAHDAEKAIFDGTQESFDQWRQAGPGHFHLQDDGSIVSVDGLGMLWYPEEYGDIALTMQWRDAREDEGYSNSGVFVRFPHPEDRYLCEPQGRPAWVAIGCGHEIQIYDGPEGEVQKTGSIYNFAPLDLSQARPTPKREWDDYEIRTVGDGDYDVTVIRNGDVLNEWTNSPFQFSSRSQDPPTFLRQYDSGYIGLQNHGSSDLTEFRDVRVRDLAPETAVTVSEPGTHTLEFRSVDVAGNVERTRQVTFTIAG